MSFTIFQVYYYYPFSALSDPVKLYNDLRWNITRPQGFEAVMRVRCSQVVFLVYWSYCICNNGFYFLDICSILVCWYLFLLLIIGYSSSRIPWKLLQTHSNRCWPTWGLYIYIMLVYHCVIIRLHLFFIFHEILNSQKHILCWPAVTLIFWSC